MWGVKFVLIGTPYMNIVFLCLYAWGSSCDVGVAIIFVPQVCRIVLHARNANNFDGILRSRSGRLGNNTAGKR